MQDDRKLKDGSTPDPKEDNEKNIIAFILSGSVRMEVFAYLTSKPSYAFKIAQDKELNASSVIRSL
ncbi:MAG: hypothetical protein ACFFAE_10525 [Candidatus Hodarchaeota archaeon]